MEVPLQSEPGTPAPSNGAGARQVDGRSATAPGLARSLARRALTVVAASAVIAFLVTGIYEDSFRNHLVYSLCIGFSCWFFIEVGRQTIFRWARRRALRRGAPRSMLPPFRWMLPWIVVSALLGYEIGMALGNALLGQKAPGLGMFATNPRALAVVLIITILTTLAMTFWWFARASLAESEARAEVAHRVASETQLKLLEAQLEPHMLFNTLANLRVLIAVDPERAQAMLDRLIAFLRTTLHASRADLQPLAEEFARVADYLALMAIRMGPRLEVKIDLPDDLRDLPVPPLLLQPLIENSIKHGLEPKVQGGCIEIAARRDADRLVLTVRDSGVGLSEQATTAGTRFGLGQVRQRLATLYAERAQVALEPANDADGGTIARIVLPLALPAAA
ncbi:MAG TPA: histidine kinase [Burkholderiaceae bacterium]|nr:histidine kinase [Burkholderiaceae bacterium]